jgi:hypothetical protein
MSVSKSGHRTHDNTVNAAEMSRQIACAGATQAACVIAEIAFYRTALASAKANGIGIEPIVAALRQLGTGGV